MAAEEAEKGVSIPCRLCPAAAPSAPRLAGHLVDGHRMAKDEAVTVSKAWAREAARASRPTPTEPHAPPPEPERPKRRLSEQGRAQLREALNRPEVREKRRAAAKAAWSRPEVRRKMLDALNRPGVQEKKRAASSARMTRIHQFAKAMAAMTSAG